MVDRGGCDAGESAAEEVQRRDVIFRLIVHGLDRLASHVYRRVRVDRARVTSIDTPPPLAWAQLAQCALLEGLVTEVAARLRRPPELLCPQFRPGTAPGNSPIMGYCGLDVDTGRLMIPSIEEYRRYGPGRLGDTHERRAVP